MVRQGWRVAVNTIAEIMSEFGLVAGNVRRRRGLTRPGKRPAAPDFVRRDFTGASAVNAVPLTPQGRGVGGCRVLAGVGSASRGRERWGWAGWPAAWPG
ncbi:hypothetical protein [Streptomyces mirabilis]|uniref:hypothetical protein n=1 Tax=Streptomyces mirabilis TaxID=68239 RepID=UPI0033C49632